MELRQLRYFVAVAEELHFGRAAARLYLSPPALSQAIRGLERELGTPLLTRSPAVALTPAGAMLLEHARAVLGQLDETLVALKGLARGRRPSLTVANVGLGAGELTGPLVRAFRAAHPGVGLRVRELDYAGQAELLAGRVDVAFVRPPLAEHGLEVIALAEEPRVAVLPAAHPHARAAVLPVAAILDERYVGFAPDAPPGWPEFWWLDAERGGASPRIGDQGVRTCLEMLAAVALDGDVVTAPASLARLVAFDGVVFVPLADASPSAIALACRAGDERPHVAAFVRTAGKLAPSRAAQAAR